ncbi:DUF2505 family protein [Acinetobacter sp. SwsAc6]|jgi:hypothetical protein|uniref:DUF2505 family protein n=1 Tax=Acinetobacter TaxID=469 RepID=UPI000D11F728|nr:MULTISPECIES: DUF2505 family protein [Acinetobacter]NWK74727.1 DUF2505 family protein [Acinetobacter sp. SwsAc6]QCO21452.1 DUF2505 family protein [Acinetobacter cumulans]RKG42897.1 DUF2505 family protein [Acinetobacter cumulans]RKG49178.1 DUF2505 family protein [Acinetobacter cumulans]RZG58794.1 DUF2505 family protein [Acinetobacter sp. WCHAc060006]
MAHQFTVQASIQGISLQDFKRLAARTELHEAVCKRIPGEQLEIIESEKMGDIYTLKRAYNLDVKIPDTAKKFLKDAFRLHRTDVSNLEAMTSEVILKPNLPLKANCQRRVTGDDTHVVFHLDWNVNIKVPLIGGMLERHAESEIRRFSQVEIEIIEDELRKHL